MLRLFSATALLGLLTACSPEPDVQLTNGEVVSWQNTEKTIVVNYFAEWCAPCLRELPELNEFYHQQAQADDRLQLVGVSFDPLNNQQIRQLKQQQGIDYPLALATPAPKFPFERPNMLPATYIIAADGTVHGPLMGEQTLTSLQQAVADAQ